MTQPSLQPWAGQFLSVLRLVAGFLFIVHGTQKWIGFPVPPPGGPADLNSLMGVAGIIETIGGALLLAGLFTRPIAFLLSGEMAVAYFMQHAPGSFWPMLNGGELAVLYCFLFLYFVVAGPGPWSLDALIGSRQMRGQHRPLETAHAGSRSV
jgi:putative oxidoreductase